MAHILCIWRARRRANYDTASFSFLILLAIWLETGKDEFSVFWDWNRKRSGIAPVLECLHLADLTNTRTFWWKFIVLQLVHEASTHSFLVLPGTSAGEPPFHLWRLPPAKSKSWRLIQQFFGLNVEISCTCVSRLLSNLLRFFFLFCVLDFGQDGPMKECASQALRHRSGLHIQNWRCHRKPAICTKMRGHWTPRWSWFWFLW